MALYGRIAPRCQPARQAQHCRRIVANRGGAWIGSPGWKRSPPWSRRAASRAPPDSSASPARWSASGSSALEQAMGVQFLRRTTRKLSVTGPGEEFYERCRRILAEFREATGELTQLQREPRGTLKVNAPMSFGQLHLAPSAARIHVRAPRHRRPAHPDRPLRRRGRGRATTWSLRIGALRGSSLIARRLCPIRRVLCASPGYLAQAGTPTRPGRSPRSPAPPVRLAGDRPTVALDRARRQDRGRRAGDASASTTVTC